MPDHSFDLVRKAVAAADEAAERGGLTIRKLDDIGQIEDAVELFREIWGRRERDILGVATMRALSHSGNYVYGAYTDSGMVGAIAGFLGWHKGMMQLHSHVLGVSPAAQDRKVGFTLKEHQRGWALSKGIRIVTWTYDPLVRRNAYFNLAKLGAVVTAYYQSFYGLMNDEINSSDESDRVLIQWDLASPRAIEASRGRGLDVADSQQERAAEIVLAVGDGEVPIGRAASADTLLVAIPRDIVQLRRRDPVLAHRWRLVLREILGDRLRAGYITTGMTREGYYVLERNG